MNTRIRVLTTGALAAIAASVAIPAISGAQASPAGSAHPAHARPGVSQADRLRALEGRRLHALTLAAVAAQIGASPASARNRAWPVCTTSAAHEQSYPDAVPPILPPPRCAELPEIRRAEAQEAAAVAYHLPPSAAYSNAEMNVFASEGYGRA